MDFFFCPGLFFRGPLNAPQACAQLDLQAASFDRRDCPLMDILTPWGLLTAGSLVLATRFGGTVHIAPQCSSWLWMSRFTSKRNENNVLGNDARADVQQGNSTAMAVPGTQSPCTLSQKPFGLEPCHALCHTA